MDFFSVLLFEKLGYSISYSGKNWEALFAASVSAYPAATITGVPPLTFLSKGGALDDYTISGNTVQNGTPTPEAPVDVVGCGVWDETQQSYKLPLTVNGTEYPIYLGQVETTRQIKKLVLTGEENWIKDSDLGQSARYYISISDIENGTTKLLSSHFTKSVQYELGTIRGYRKTIIFSVDKTLYATVTDFKAWLAQKYANGTPVTVWYAIAEPATGIVNEPLHKIGDYADTITMAQAGETIPTIAGSNTLSVGTTVQPSSVSITGHIKPVTS